MDIKWELYKLASKLITDKTVETLENGVKKALLYHIKWKL